MMRFKDAPGVIKAAQHNGRWVFIVTGCPCRTEHAKMSEAEACVTSLNLPKEDRPLPLYMN